MVALFSSNAPEDRALVVYARPAGGTSVGMGPAPERAPPNGGRRSGPMGLLGTIGFAGG